MLDGRQSIFLFSKNYKHDFDLGHTKLRCELIPDVYMLNIREKLDQNRFIERGTRGMTEYFLILTLKLWIETYSRYLHTEQLCEVIPKSVNKQKC